MTTTETDQIEPKMVGLVAHYSRHVALAVLVAAGLGQVLPPDAVGLVVWLALLGVLVACFVPQVQHLRTTCDVCMTLWSAHPMVASTWTELAASARRHARHCAGSAGMQAGLIVASLIAIILAGMDSVHRSMALVFALQAGYVLSDILYDRTRTAIYVKGRAA